MEIEQVHWRQWVALRQQNFGESESGAGLWLWPETHHMFWICDACPFGRRPDQDMVPTRAPYCDIHWRTDPQIWCHCWYHIDWSVLMYGSWAVRTGYVSILAVVTLLKCWTTRHRYSMVTCLYLCLPKIFQHIGIPPVVPWSLHVDLCCEIVWESLYGVHSAHLLQVRNVCCGNYVSSWLQNWLHCEFCAQPRLAFGLQMAESQPPIMIYMMIGQVMANQIRCGEMEGLIHLIGTGH